MVWSISVGYFPSPSRLRPSTQTSWGYYSAEMAPAVGGPQGYTPPEGGWGWMVVIGAFISIGFSYAFPKSITVFFKEIEVIFDVTSSQVSWISSIMLACMYGGGKISFPFSKLFCTFNERMHPFNLELNEIFNVSSLYITQDSPNHSVLSSL